MAEDLKISLVQADLAWSDPQANRVHLEAMVRERPGSDLYVLPETFTTGFLGQSPDGGEDMEGPTVAWMRSLAERMNGGIAGSAQITIDGERRNRLLLAHPDGEINFYDKKHLFSFGGEGDEYRAGDERKVFDFRGWRICPQICYDLRFPVWCRNRDDYDLLLFVANWPAARVAAWDALLRARAIENQSYVVAVNRLGTDGRGLDYVGHSAVYDPLGEPILPPWENELVRTAVVDREEVETVRRDFPFSADADQFELG